MVLLLRSARNSIALSAIPFPLEEIGEEGRLFGRIIQSVMGVRPVGKKIRGHLITSRRAIGTSAFTANAVFKSKQPEWLNGEPDPEKLTKYQ